MPVYGSAAAVKDLLSSDGTQIFTEPQEARLLALLETVSALIEDRTGAVFGSGIAETVEVEGQDDDTLFLEKGIRSVTSIVEHPATWTGSAWTGGTTLATADYRLAGKVSRRTKDGVADAIHYRKLLRVSGVWSGLYVVTGVWEDRVATVPDDITYLANYLSAEIFKKQPMSPAGFVGPDGTAVSLRNAFTEPEVRAILDKWTIGELVGVV